jgi:hypothetical protein
MVAPRGPLIESKGPVNDESQTGLFGFRLITGPLSEGGMTLSVDVEDPDPVLAKVLVAVPEALVVVDVVLARASMAPASTSRPCRAGKADDRNARRTAMKQVERRIMLSKEKRGLEVWNS